MTSISSMSLSSTITSWSVLNSARISLSVNEPDFKMGTALFMLITLSALVFALMVSGEASL